jgi:signal peptidase I
MGAGGRGLKLIYKIKESYMKLIKTTLEWCAVILISCTIALLVHVFLIQPTKVMGVSMEPTYYQGNYLLINRLGRIVDAKLEHGDIVVIDSRIDHQRTFIDAINDSMNDFITMFKVRNARQNMWVKRVIGLPNDKIRISNGKVYVNNVLLVEPYIKNATQSDSTDEFIVPAGMVYIMGDNRENSHDSRKIGPVPIDHVLGVVLIKI